ncbi:MAG: ABC transporter ATP-binding protein [Betaproteobacteria bacterium]|nr:ABC transporter ATP-binding protein [Betaproteobacteria bacterium]
MREVLLRATAISKTFGGLIAVDNVSLELRRGEIHALIGTNGAGKSTLINVLTGELRGANGRVELDGQDISAWPQHRRARAGLGRSYQRTNIFPGFTVFENCRLAAQAGYQRPWALGQAAGRCAVSGGAAQRALRLAGLEGHEHRLAGIMAHGQQRQLEIAMCLATAPRVLLLDEPLAGMGAEETVRMLELLQGLQADHAILLVEHDMDAVFRVSSQVTVMVDGKVLASAAPEAIRANPAVQQAYLGGAQ